MVFEIEKSGVFESFCYGGSQGMLFGRCSGYKSSKVDYLEVRVNKGQLVNRKDVFTGTTMSSTAVEDVFSIMEYTLRFLNQMQIS